MFNYQPPIDSTKTDTKTQQIDFRVFSRWGEEHGTYIETFIIDGLYGCNVQVTKDGWQFGTTHPDRYFSSKLERDAYIDRRVRGNYARLENRRIGPEPNPLNHHVKIQYLLAIISAPTLYSYPQANQEASTRSFRAYRGIFR